MSQRKHSVSVPRLFKEAAIILRRAKAGEGLQDLIFNCRHYNIKGIYAMVCTSLKNYTLLENIINETDLSNVKMDPYLAKILVTELLWGKKHLAGGSKPVKKVLALKENLEKAVEESDIPVDIEIVIKPRYARINTTLATINGVIKQFEGDEWSLVDTPDSYDSFLECVANLADDQFMKDYHFPDVLVFSTKAGLHDYHLVEKGHIILQDKTSCLPAHVLNPEPGSVVLDMCAAPGLKTMHIMNLMENKGTLFAVDRNEKRYGQMLERFERYCGLHNCIQSKLADSTQLTCEECPGVQYILVDPSCSGTGMTKRMDDSANYEVTSKRLEKLSNFQERLLVQALTAFPEVKRVVYSTCSLLPEENEKVIERVLARVPSFQVVAPKLDKNWEHRGNSQYPFGSKCLVADMDRDRTNGFFVALLEKVEGGSPKKENILKGKILKRKSTEATNDGWEFPKKKMLAKKGLANKMGKKKKKAIKLTAPMEEDK